MAGYGEQVLGAADGQLAYLDGAPDGEHPLRGAPVPCALRQLRGLRLEHLSGTRQQGCLIAFLF